MPVLLPFGKNGSLQTHSVKHYRSRTLEEVWFLLEVLSREAGVYLLACRSTIAARQNKIG